MYGNNNYNKSLFNQSSLNLNNSIINQLTVNQQLDITNAKLVGLDVDNITIEFPTSVNLRVKDLGITTNKLADASVTDQKIVSVSGSKVTGNIDIDQIKVNDGSESAPSYSFKNSSNTGFYYVSPNILNLSINGSKKIEYQNGFIKFYTSIDAGNIYVNNIIAITSFSSGVVHSDSGGNLSSSLIVDSDITNGTITESKLAGSIPDSKLMTILSPGKVENSATSATPLNTPFTLVERDSLGDIQVNMLSSNQVGTTTIFTINFTTSNATVNGNITVSGTVDGRDVSTDGNNLDYLYTTIGLNGLTAGEVNQLKNINSNTISNTQWGYLSALNQGLSTSSSPSFSNISVGSSSVPLVAVTTSPGTGSQIAAFGSSSNSNRISFYDQDTISDGASIRFNTGFPATIRANGSIQLRPNGTSTSCLTVADVATRFVDGSVSTPGISFLNDTDTGLYRIGNNNVGISCNGAKQLDISSTNVTSTPNLKAPNIVLTDAHATNSFYATGTWTPKLGDGINIFTTSTATGNFTRIGNMYYCWIQIIWISKGSASGNITISLPETISSSSPRVAATPGYIQGITVSKQLVIAGDGGTSFLNFWDFKLPIDGTTALNEGKFEPSGELQLNCFFMV